MSHAGTVKWYNFRKGFGFIEPKEGGGEDLFVHATHIEGNPLKDGDEVKYNLGTDEKTGKPCAIDVSGGSGWPSGERGGKGGGRRRTYEARDGDWDCPACGAEGCFGSKDKCHKCGAPKP